MSPSLPKRLLVILASVSAVSGLAACSAATRSPRDAIAPADRAALVGRIDSLVEAHLSTTPASGAAVAVVRGRDTIVMRGYGLADRATGRLVTDSTVFQIASITKQITAAAVMRLVEQGRLGLDDDLSKHLPEFPLRGRRVSIRRLLNHTSGIPNYTNKPEWRSLWAQDVTPDSLIRLVARDSFDFEPGTNVSYNNTGYTMLGLIIERVTGKPYWQYFADEFFTPLGLARTRYCPTPAERDSTVALGYTVVNGAFAPAQFISRTHPNAAGAVCSTVREYLLFHRALHEGRLVNGRSYAQMTTPDTLDNGLPTTYGLGLFTDRLGTRQVITHGGSISGFTTAQIYLPAESLSVVMFTNTDARGPEPTALNIARAVLRIPLMPRTTRRATAPLTAADRAAYPGTYDLVRPDGRPLPLHVSIAGETLVARMDGIARGSSPLVYQGNDTFAVTLDPTMRLTFVRVGGTATAARLERIGVVYQGARRP